VETIGVQFAQLLILLVGAFLALRLVGVARARVGGVVALAAVVLEPVAGPVVETVQKVRPSAGSRVSAPSRAPPGDAEWWLENRALDRQ
jgi:hypothetical protein